MGGHKTNMKMLIFAFISLFIINSTIAGSKKISVGEPVDNCIGVENGDYQSPDGCDYYVTCSNNHIERKRPCPVVGVIILEWDDKRKKCVYHSETCPDVPGPTPTFPPTKDTPTPTFPP